jgi:HEAT repeat protein/ATP/ADP translocase
MIGAMTRLARSLGIRPGEGRLVGLVAGLFAAIEAARGFGEIGVDTLFLSRYGAAFLPYLFIGLGLTSLVAAIAYGAALGRLRRGPLLVGLLAGGGGLIALLRVLLMAAESTVLPVLWLAVYAAGMIAVTIAWTMAGAVFDARQAKRLFPVCTSAAIGGSFVGTLGSGPLARLAGTETLVLVEAVLLAAAAVLIVRIARTSAGSRLRSAPLARTGASGGRRSGRSLVAELRAGFDEVVRSPLLRLVSVAYVLFSVLAFSVTFPFLEAMTDAYPAEADLATALGLLSAAVTATSFVVSLVIAPRLYARLGVATAALLLPLVYLIGFGVWLVQFGVTTAVAVRFAQQVTQRGVSNAAWSAFYNVVPADRRAQVLAFVDGVPGQIGIALSGVLLLAAGSLLAADQVFWMGAVAAVLCTAVVVAIRRRYGESLLRTLRTGLGERMLEGGPGLGSLGGGQVTSALVAGLEAPDPAVRMMAAELLGRAGGPAAVSALADQINDEDPGVRAATLDALASLRPTSPDVKAAVARFDDREPNVRQAAIRAAAAIDPPVLLAAAPGLLSDPDPGVRAALAVALVRAGEEDRPHALLAALLEADRPTERIAGLEAVGQLGGHSPSDRVPAYLADPSPEVRAAAVRALAAMDGSETMGGPFLAALDDGARVVRATAAGVLRNRPSLPDGVIDVLLHGSPRAQEAALGAMEGHGGAVREPLLAWAAGQVTRATQLRRRRVALDSVPGAGADAPPDRSASFLAFLLARREADIELRLLQALGVLGAPEAGGLIRRCLRSNDPDTRAQAMEALDSIGDGRLRRAIVGLLDERPAEGAAESDAVLRELTEDPDGWVRALALRARAEAVAAAWLAVRDQAAGDPDPAVQAALRPILDQGGPLMPDITRTFGDVDRMLFLRRVPLFRELEPEDLQRIAATATECLYAPGEALVREGDIGSDMVIIVEGTVRVVRSDEGGEERLLRGYGPGDHIGELAVLREQPRAATVLAEEPGVRGLVIAGEGVMAILRERPDAAMAMLATLAERIGRQ